MWWASILPVLSFPDLSSYAAFWLASFLRQKTPWCEPGFWRHYSGTKNGAIILVQKMAPETGRNRTCSISGKFLSWNSAADWTIDWRSDFSKAYNQFLEQKTCVVWTCNWCKKTCASETCQSERGFRSRHATNKQMYGQTDHHFIMPLPVEVGGITQWCVRLSEAEDM